MKFIKKLKRFFVLTFCVAIMLCTGVLVISDSNIAFAANSTVGSFLSIGDLLFTDYASKSKKFNGSKLDSLYTYLTGKTNATLADVDAYISSSNAVSKYGSRIVKANALSVGKNNKFMVLKFGGESWTVTSLTKDTEGNIVATLLQYGNYTQSVWNKWWKDSTSEKYPCSMYATSFIRNETLNANGCGYIGSASATTLTNANKQNSSNKYALYTMPSVTGSLTNYIVKPSKIKYQEFENYKNESDSKQGYTWANDAYGTPNGTINGSYYTPLKDKTYYNTWKDDYIWLPSYSEIGQWGSLWECFQGQRRANAEWYLRSGNGYGTIIDAAGNFNSYATNNSRAVRACLHLNLTAAEKDSSRSVLMPNNVTYTYDGTAKSFSSLTYYDSSKMTFTSADGLDAHTDVGTYTATFTAKDGFHSSGSNPDLKTRTVTITITPKPVDTPEDVSFIYDGSPHVFEKLSWFDETIMDISYDPNYNFTDVATYTATVTLKSDNYKFSTTEERSVTVQLIMNYRPISPKDITFEYDGQDHTNILTLESWYNAAFVDFEHGEGNLTDAGTYKIKIVLINDNVIFSSLGTTTRETEVTITINKKVISVQTLPITEQGTLREGESIQPNIAIYERDITNGTAPEFGIEYLKSGGTAWFKELPTNAGKYSARAYIINADNCNYVLDKAGDTTFTKPKQVVAVPYFTGDNVTSANITGSTTTVQYNGREQFFTLVNNSDGTAASNFVIGELTGNLTYTQGSFRAKAVGVYTVAVTLSDPLNMQWSDSASNSSNTRIITLVITKAELTVEIANFDEIQSSWEKGEVDSIILHVKGIVNGEAVALKVYYKPVGGDIVLVPDDAMVVEGDMLVVTINTENFSANTKYQLYVELDEEKDINRNYTLVNMTAPFEFFVLQATIKEVNINWQSNNLVAGMGVEIVDGAVIEYNGQPYTISLDPSKLPKGVIVTYSNEEATNVGNYITQVTLTCEEGYEFASGIQTVYSINWRIKPLEYDLGVLTWADDKEFIYNMGNYTMSIINSPSWIDSQAAGGIYKNTARDVGVYTAGYTLYSDENHIFTNNSSFDWIEILNDGTTATVTREWRINKVTIEVSNAPRQWVEREYVIESTGETIIILEPLVYEEFSTYLLLEYFTDSAFQNQIQLEDIEVVQGAVTYYVRVRLNPESESTHVVENTLNHTDYAWTSFEVGDDRLPITITHNYKDNKTVYNGEAQPLIPKYGSLAFSVKYFVQDENGDFTIELGEGEIPTNAGLYFVEIEIEGDLKDVYKIKNRSFIITIEQVVLTTNGWTYSGGLELPTCNVVSEKPVPSGVFEYVVYDEYGQIVTGNISFNKSYVVKLVLTDSINYKFGEGARTEYEFRAFGEEQEVIKVAKPIISEEVLVYNGYAQSFVIANWDLIKEYVYIISGNLTQTEVGTYKILFGLKSDHNAIWDDDTFSEVELTVQITPLVITVPTVEEIRYTGSEINVFDHLLPFANWGLFVELTADSDSNLQTAVGNYVLKFKYKPEFVGSIIIESAGGDEPTTFKILREVVDGEEVVTISWEIKEGLIVGSWENKDGVAVFVPEDEADKDKFTIVYLDKDGNEVAIADMIDGETYTAVLKLADADNYIVVNKDHTEAETTTEFEYKAPEPGFAEKFAMFIKANWLWLLIAIAVLILLIIIIVAAKKHKKKKQALLLAKKEEEDKKPKQEQKGAKQNESTNSDALDAERQKFEQEKLELQKQLDELKASMGQNNSTWQQPVNQPYFAPNYNAQPPVNMGPNMQGGYNYVEPMQYYQPTAGGYVAQPSADQIEPRQTNNWQQYQPKQTRQSFENISADNKMARPSNFNVDQIANEQDMRAQASGSNNQSMGQMQGFDQRAMSGVNSTVEPQSGMQDVNGMSDFEKFKAMLDMYYAEKNKKQAFENMQSNQSSYNASMGGVSANMSQYEQELKAMQQQKARRKQLEQNKNLDKLNELRERRKQLEANQEVLRSKISELLKDNKDN